MKENYIHKSKYFYGNKISEHGIARGYIDFRTLAKAFDAVLCNDITRLFYNTIGGEYIEPEIINGLEYDENDAPAEIFQYYIISENGARILQELTAEIVYYIPAVDLYVWGVTHYGTAWDHVLTEIKIEMEG